MQLPAAPLHSPSPPHPASRFATLATILTVLVPLAPGCGGGSGDGIPDGPHALGAVSLGEAHATSGGAAVASVSASFAPDADGPGASPVACTRTVAGCELPLVPDCGGTCAVDQFCGFDDGCAPTCHRLCDAACAEGEECYFPSPDAPSCRQRQSFDAGSITIAGGTTPVTLFPPYAFAGADQGALFVDGAGLTVTASGAASAGYAPFSAEFTATAVIRSQPPLDQLGITAVFGADDVPVRWVAGADQIRIAATVTGSDGKVASLACPASDPTGSYDLPREALDAALGGAALAQLTVAIQRTRVETRYDLATTGELSGITVQPVGWLALTTSSTESTVFEGCGGTEVVCGEACVDVTSDGTNCGECGHDCPGSEACEQGTCFGVASCNACIAAQSSGGGACAAASSACDGNPACAELKSCIAGCAGSSTCNQACATSNPDGIDDYNAWGGCLCNTGCSIECLEVC